MASIKLPDGSVKEVADGTTVGQVAESIGRGLAKTAVVGKVDGKLVDLSYKLTGNHDNRARVGLLFERCVNEGSSTSCPRLSLSKERYVDSG